MNVNMRRWKNLFLLMLFSLKEWINERVNIFCNLARNESKMALRTDVGRNSDDFNLQIALNSRIDHIDKLRVHFPLTLGTGALL